MIIITVIIFAYYFNIVFRKVGEGGGSVCVPTGSVCTVHEDMDDLLQLSYGPAPDKKTHRIKPTEQSSIPQPLPDLVYDFSGLAE